MARLPNGCIVVGNSLILILAAGCGGGGSGGGGSSPSATPTSFRIGGTVSGLNGTGLVLQNGGDNLAVSVSGAFTFATKVRTNDSYSVTVQRQPTGPAQTCTASNAAGTVGTQDVTSVSVDCVANRFAVGGTVSGLAGTGLVLQNNGGGDLAVAQSGGFAFTARPTSGSVYSVSVSTQPTNPDQTCAVSLGTGTVGSADVGDVGVECATSTTVSAASLSGSYRIVGYEPLASRALIWRANFDGTGAFDGLGTRIDSSGATTSATLSGNYSVAPDGTTVVTETGQAALTGRLGSDGGDRHRVVLAQLTPGVSPAIAVGLRQGQLAFTNANLAGHYTLIFYNHTVEHGAVATAMFDGNGNFHYTETENDAGVITTASNGGTYSVTADGTLTLLLPLEDFTFVGGISADADTLAAARTNSGAPSMIVGIRQTGTFTVADFAGIYADVSFHSEGNVGVLATLNADGLGTFTASETRNHAGGISTATVTGNYVVDPSGALRLTLTDGSTRDGAIGARGRAGVLTETTAGIGPSLHFGTR